MPPFFLINVGKYFSQYFVLFLKLLNTLLRTESFKIIMQLNLTSLYNLCFLCFN